MATILLDQSTYDPLTLPSGTDHEVRNDHSSGVEIANITPQPVGTVVRLQLVGNNGTEPVYLGTEGSLTLVPGGDNVRLPRAMPLDEVAVLTMAAGAGPTGGDAWLVMWE